MRTIWRISFRALPEAAQGELLSRLPIRNGSVLSDELLQKAVQTVKEFDQRLEIRVNDAPFLVAGHHAVTVMIYDPAAGLQRIRIEATQQAAMLLERPIPTELSTRGVVHLEVIVAKDGTVRDASPLAGPESSLEPAADAVRRWRYKPTLLNGVPVEVKTTVEVNLG